MDEIYLIESGENFRIVDLEKKLENNSHPPQELNCDCIDIHSIRPDILNQFGRCFRYSAIFNTHLPEWDEYKDIFLENCTLTELNNALKWYLLAASFDHKYALSACYRIYKFGIGVAVNEQIAKKYLLRLRKQGYNWDQLC
jgi:hypothetical protein